MSNLLFISTLRRNRWQRFNIFRKPLPMKKYLFLCVAVMSAVLLMQCESGLTRSEAERMITEGKIYPIVIDYKVFCNHTDEAKKVAASDLDENGFVTAQLQHTVADVGTPLVKFTEKAQPYLLTTSDTAKALDVQRVKIADENFLKIVNITTSNDGKSAVVDFVTTMDNPTPFSVLVSNDVTKQQPRRTYFALTEQGWTWDKKIVKMPMK